MSIIIQNSEVCVEFSDVNGAISGIIRNGIELTYPAKELFSLQLLDKTGNAYLIYANSFAKYKYNNRCFNYSKHPDFPELVVNIYVDSDEKFVKFKHCVTGIQSNYVLEWIDAPQLCYKNEMSLFHPLHDGVVITEPLRRNPNAKYHPIKFAERGVSYGTFFPNRAQMQFLAAYNKKSGFYFAAHDSSYISKAVEYDPHDEGFTRLSLQTFTDCNFGDDYESPFEYVIGAFDGDWIKACSIYRDWFESIAPAPAAFPAWFEKSPVMLIYPVKGEGDDKGELLPNEYYPYTNILPYVKYFNKHFNSCVMPLLMHWEGTAPWAPPYVWPPYGGTENMSELRDALHAGGNLLGVYCSGTAWTQSSSISDYSQEEKCEQENLYRYMMRGPKGEINATVCNGENSQRLGYDLCVTENWSRQTIKDEILKLATFGIDYAQFFDQNHGGGAHLCYSHEHKHPPVPGAWQTQAMTSLMKDTLNEIKAQKSNMVMGCESAAAEPYINYLLLNDARSSFVSFYGVPVPGHSFVFHGRTNCFSGNQSGISTIYDLKKSPENLLYRIAYSFNAGDFLSIVLKDGGNIHWGWNYKWSNMGPDQKSIITLIRNLNAMRKKYPQFLLYGKMLEPLEEIRGDKWNLYLQEESLELDSFLHSSWESPQGEKAHIISNFLPEDQTVICAGKKIKLEALNAVLIMH